eukprot:6471651-Pyramimonas_sp.AAC.1
MFARLSETSTWFRKWLEPNGLGPGRRESEDGQGQGEVPTRSSASGALDARKTSRHEPWAMGGTGHSHRARPRDKANPGS